MRWQFRSAYLEVSLHCAHYELPPAAWQHSHQPVQRWSHHKHLFTDIQTDQQTMIVSHTIITKPAARGSTSRENWHEKLRTIHFTKTWMVENSCAKELAKQSNTFLCHLVLTPTEDPPTSCNKWLVSTEQQTSIINELYVLYIVFEENFT